MRSKFIDGIFAGIIISTVLYLIGIEVPRDEPEPKPFTPPREKVVSEIDRLWTAVCLIESGGRADPPLTEISRREQSVGIAQIRPICLRDCNRIVGYERWTLEDRRDPVKSREMFDTYMGHYGKGCSLFDLACIWNGGPKGPSKPAAQAYARKVLSVMK